MSKDVILTGLRANSEFHIGNYLGAILPVVELQKRHAGEYQVNMFVPDLHSFTTPIDHSKLYQQIIKNLRVFVAAGLDIQDPDTFIYRQSFVPAHSELTWILTCFTKTGELERMTQFKSKSGRDEKEDLLRHSIELGKKEIERTSNLLVESKTILKVAAENSSEFIIHENQDIDYRHYWARLNELNSIISDIIDNLNDLTQTSNATYTGLMNYPVLMAADILLYGAKYVPVGEDQRQHLELTRDLAIRMNNKFGSELFTVPEDWKAQLAFAQRDNGVRIRSLRNPEKKMSKSVSDPSGTIMMFDDPADAAKKVMKAETDSVGTIHYDFATQPGISNLLQMLALLSERPQAEVNVEWEGKQQYGDLKKVVAHHVQEFLANFQAAFAQTDEDAILAKLQSDEAAMNTAANKTLFRVQKAVGLRTKAGLPKGRAGSLVKPKQIDFDSFAAADIRVGTVVAAEKLPGSDKLIKLQIDLGNETRQILTGMQQYYTPEDFVGKQMPVLVNLAPRTMMGEKSEGMLLAFEGAEGPVFLHPATNIHNGAPLE